MADEDPLSGLVAPDGYPTERAHLLAAFDEQAKGLTERPTTLSLLKAMGWLTTAAREGKWTELAKRLRHDLPAILQRLGLTLELEGVISHVIDRCQSELGDRRVTDVLPGWLTELAAQRGVTLAATLTPDEVRQLIAATATKDIIGSRLASERTGWGRRLLSWLLQQGPDVLGGDLRDIVVPNDVTTPSEQPWVRGYLDKLADSMDDEMLERLAAYQSSAGS